MAYNTQELKQQILEAIQQYNLFFFEDVYVNASISSYTFYEHFPKDSNDYKDIRAALTANKIKTKQAMRKKWFDNDNATLQVALMKIIGNDRDRKRLNQTHHDITTKGDKLPSASAKDVALYLQKILEDDNETETSDTENS